MPDKLPKGWVRTSLGEVCLPVVNIRPGDSPAVEFTYFDIGGIDNEKHRIAETKTITGGNAPSRAQQALQKDDILFSTVRTYLRKIARLERDYPNPVASTGLAVIRAAEGVSSQFLFFQVLSESFLQPLNALQSGTSYPAVRARDVFAQPILLPPTSEQERIVTKLDAALSRLERAEMAARRAKERLTRYRAAVLHAAVNGELTREWRKTHKPDATKAKLLQRLLNARRSRWEETNIHGFHNAGKPPKDTKWKSRYREPRPLKATDNRKLPPGWTWASIEQVSLRVTVGYVGTMKNEYVPRGIPFLRSQNIRANRFDPEGLLFISPEFHARLSKSKILPGDVAVVRSGNVGTTCVIPKSLGEANCSDLVLVQRPLIEPQFISFYMNSAAQKHIESGKVGIALTHFNTASVASLAISVPPKSEQIEIIREVEGRMAAVDKLSKTLNRQLERVRLTRQSLLHEAVTGRLVPQDPKDQPASTLLERIRATREVEAKKPKGKRMSKSKSKPVRRFLLDVLREHKKPMTPEQLFREAGFQPAQADLFYRELVSLRKLIRETKPTPSEAKTWPHRAHVLLELKRA